jgi:amino acid transporter
MSEGEQSLSSGVEVNLNRDLGLAEVLMIGLGPNIGSSVFLLIGLATEYVGPALLITFLLNFVVTVFTALAYAELSSAFPETGGGYLWIKEGLFETPWLPGRMDVRSATVSPAARYAIGFGTGVTLLLQQYNLSLFGMSMETDLVDVHGCIRDRCFCFLNYRGVCQGCEGRSERYGASFLVASSSCFLHVLAWPSSSVRLRPPECFRFEPFLPFGYLSIATSMGVHVS